MVESLQDKMCRCDKSPRLVGQGSAAEPFELEYADEVVLPSPNPSSYATPPVENEAPLPTPTPASVLDPSDKENCRRCPITPRVPFEPLVPVKGMAIDRTEDALRVVEVHPTVTGQRCKRSRYSRSHRMTASNGYPRPVESDGDQSGRDEGRRFKYSVHRGNQQVTSEVQLRHNLRLAHADPTQGSNEGDGGSLFDYVDSAAEQSPGPGDAEPGTPKFSDLWAAGGSLRRSLFISA
jgi:hypothetical protein